MSASEILELDPVRQKHLEAKLGKLLTWSKPNIFESVGPYDPGPFEKYDATRREHISECVEELKRYTDEQVAIISDKSQSDPQGIRDVWGSFGGDHLKRFRSYNLPWYAGGFGHPDYQADFKYWSKMSYFSIDEILCVSIGIEPKYFSASKLKELAAENQSELWPALAFLVQQREQLRREFASGRYSPPVHPAEFIKWVDKVNFVVVPEFLTLLRTYHGGGATAPRTGAQPSDTAPKKQDKREVESIAQLFTAMAMEYFGYNPNDVKSSVTKEITDLAASMGMSLSDDTVRRYLRMGGSYVPKDWIPNNR